MRNKNGEKERNFTEGAFIPRKLCYIYGIASYGSHEHGNRFS